MASAPTTGDGKQGGGGDVLVEQKKETTIVAVNTIKLSVKDQNGEETWFKIKKTTNLENIFATYAKNKGVDRESIRFLIDGERISPEETPESFKLEN